MIVYVLNNSPIPFVAGDVGKPIVTDEVVIHNAVYLDGGSLQKFLLHDYYKKDLVRIGDVSINEKNIVMSFIWPITGE